jgi:hypothetical protein
MTVDDPADYLCHGVALGYIEYLDTGAIADASGNLFQDFNTTA